MKPHRQLLAERIIGEVLQRTYPAGNGGYVADVGPVTYGEMLEFLGLASYDPGVRRDGPALCPFCGCTADAPVTCARPFHNGQTDG